MAVCVTVRDPFHPVAGRVVDRIEAPCVLRDLAPDTDQPFIILHNGDAVLRADWHRPVTDDDLVAVVLLPQGGGGGGSNPLKVVLMIGVAMIAGPAAYGLYSGLGGTLSPTLFAKSALGMVMKAGIGLIGSALVNAIIPPPRLPSTRQMQSLAAPSPTYNLTAQGNLARLDEAIPVQYGRHIAYPDFAALPYTEYAGNEQYLYQLLCVGQGEYDIEAVRIEDTAIGNFEEITYETVAPGGSVTLFPTNVATSTEVSGQELLSGSYIGPFTLNASGTDVNAIAFDFVMPRGLYEVNATTGALIELSLTVKYEAREIDDAGTPVGSWTVLGTTTYTARTTTPQRRSQRVSVTTGRYEVRATRTDTKQTATTYGHEVLWSGARGYMPETRNFGNVTLLAMRMRASNNLSAQASRRVNVIATRKLPIWNGTTWSANTATSSIAWAIADLLRNTDYGAGLADSRIDLAALLALDSTWTTRGDQFCGRFENAMSLWEAAQQIGTTGRTKIFLQGGIVRFARDEAESTPVALFSMRNMKRGSFNIEYIMPSDDTADAVDVQYFDRNYWAPRRVQAKLPASSALKPARVDLFGVTDRNHAFREGIYQAASNFYRRKIIQFETEMEGFIPALGDLIAIQHDMPAWGQFADAVSWDSGTNTLVVSQPLTWDVGTHYVGLRSKNGGMIGPYTVTQGADTSTLVLSSAPSEDPYTGTDYERTQVTFGWGETWRQEAKVVSVKPRGLYHVEIEAINEDPSVHTAEDGETAPAVQTSQLTTLYTTPTIADLVMKSTTDDVSKAVLTWTPAPGADFYQIEMAYGTSPEDSNLAWTRAGETHASNFAVTALYGSATLIRVRGVGLAVGPWVTLLYGEEADYMWQADTSTLMWSATDTDLMWRY